MALVKADLHLHTCLSPCGDFDVTPAAVVARAAELGLGLIAICDHNSAENVPAARHAAKRLGPGAPHVLAGMEITTAEEAHVLALFEELDAALTMQAMVFDHLQDELNDPDLFGMQIVANADDEVEYFNPRLLIGATDLPVAEIARRAHGLGGLLVAAHIDRPSYSLVGQLGMIPPDLALDAVEISRANPPEAAQEWLMGRQFPILTSSDAHRLADVGAAWTGLEIQKPSLAELALALSGLDGRGVIGHGRRSKV